MFTLALLSAVLCAVLGAHSELGSIRTSCGSRLLKIPIALETLEGEWFLHAYTAEGTVNMGLGAVRTSLDPFRYLDCLKGLVNVTRPDKLEANITGRTFGLPVQGKIYGKLFNNIDRTGFTIDPRFDAFGFSIEIAFPLPFPLETQVVDYKEKEFLVMWSCVSKLNILMLEEVLILSRNKNLKDEDFQKIQERLRDMDLPYDYLKREQHDRC